MKIKYIIEIQSQSNVFTRGRGRPIYAVDVVNIYIGQGHPVEDGYGRDVESPKSLPDL